MKILTVFCSLLLASSLSFANNQNNVDPEIVAALVVLNQNEIAAANLAIDKTTNKTIKHYAKFLKKEHSKNLKKTIHLSKKQDITPVDNKTANELKTQGQQETSDLTKLSNNDFNKAYINDMVNDHESALSLIDGFLKEVKNPKLKKHLEETRMHVQHHLDDAKKIQEQMK